MNKVFYTWQQFDRDVVELARQIWMSGWRPDYIVGLSRGGLPLAVALSNYMCIPMKPLQVSLRDGGECVSDLGMAEDAYGYPKQEVIVSDETDFGAVLDAANDLLEQGPNYKNILIVDDINDSGATFNWIIEDWPAGCMPNDPDWTDVWNNNVKFATLWDNPASKFKYTVDYTIHIKDPEQEPWIVFPWEQPFTGEL
jgi:hypoxanthine phosphoribosyltransferase